MKPEIHPEYNDLNVTCVCGHAMTIGTTSTQLKIDICSRCHPFFTGTQKVLDAEGRIERFKKRYQK